METIYIYKGKKYRIVSTGSMKIGQLWIQCVVYQPKGSTDTYVREFNDFHEKFSVDDSDTKSKTPGIATGWD